MAAGPMPTWQLGPCTQLGPMHTAGAPFLPTPHPGLKSPSQSFPEYSSNPSFFLSASHLLNVQHTQQG